MMSSLTYTNRTNFGDRADITNSMRREEAHGNGFEVFCDGYCHSQHGDVARPSNRSMYVVEGCDEPSWILGNAHPQRLVSWVDPYSYTMRTGMPILPLTSPYKGN